jgi:hypothetical protein
LGASGKLAIQMRLRREGDKLAGSYLYESVGKDLSLRGAIDAAGDFQLQEFDAAGAQTDYRRQYRKRHQAADERHEQERKPSPLDEPAVSPGERHAQAAWCQPKSSG